MTGPVVSRGRSLRDVLPAIYLVRDADVAGGNGVLSSLLDLLDTEIGVIEAELALRYASLFIETCSDDDLVHFQELLGVRQLPGNQHPRALTGNVIAYRRGKGTIATLERAVAAASGWTAHAVEYFRLLAATQNLNHLRPGDATVPVRDPAPLAWTGTPFDPLDHLVDVRSIATDRGRYNIPNVGVHLWRLGPVTTEAASVPVAVDETRYRFHPLGIDTPIYSVGGLIDDIGVAPTGPAEPKDVTAPIGLLQMRRDLASYYGEDDKSSVCVFIDDQPVPIDDVSVCDLGDYGGGWRHVPPAKSVAIDPTRGRFAFAAAPDGTVSVRFTRAQPMEIGARQLAPPDEKDNPPIVVPRDAATLPAAITALAARPANDGTVNGTIELSGSGVFAPGATVTIPDNADVTIRASSKNWPQLDVTATPLDCGAGSSVTLMGFLIVGDALRVTGTPAAVTIDSCTLVPGHTLQPDLTPNLPDAPSLMLDLAADASTAVTLTRCISGPIQIAQPDVTLTLADTIVTGARSGGSARQEPALVSASLASFPVWPAAVSGLRLQVGIEAVLDLNLPTAPTSLDTAATALRDALAATTVDPQSAPTIDVTTITVDTHDDRLVIAVPGIGEVSAADASDTDNAATLLGLTSDSGGRSVWSLLSDAVADPPDLGSTFPVDLTGEVGEPTAPQPFDAQLASAAATVADAAAALETALTTIGDDAPLVLVADGRLRVLPGRAGEAIRFADAPATRALGLYAAAPVVAGSADGILPTSALTADHSTLLGAVHASTVNVSDSIVTGALLADRRQTGCVRYSYLGPGSLTPRQFRCVSADAGGAMLEFVSLRYGNAGFAQQTPGCASEIAEGAEDGSEMGAFSSVHQPQRLAAVRSVLAEFVRLTAISGIVLES